MITINLNDPQQEIEGFGASGAWWAQDIGGWDEPNRSRIIELLFNQETGIGLSIYRYNIGGGAQNITDPWRRTETFEVGPGEYDWSLDRNAVWVLKAAHGAGVEHFIAFANSPTARMTVSGYASGGPDGTSNLREDTHEAFAQYLVDVVRHLREDEGVPIGWISPINEPQWDWQNSKGQEGCHYTTDEIVSVLRALNEAIEADGLDVEISAVETGEWSSASIYARRIFDDSVLAEALDHFAVHSYWSSPDQKARFARFMNETYPGVDLWMSEWTEMQAGRDYGMDSAMHLANTIHDDLTIGGVTNWQYWIAVSKYNFRDGLIYTDEYLQNIRETKRLWAMGNYSRFIRPGYVRVGVEYENDNLRVAAFTDPETGQLIVTVINNHDEAIGAELSIIGEQGFSTMTQYETSEDHDLAQRYTGDINTTVEFAPQSITTLILN